MSQIYEAIPIALIALSVIGYIFPKNSAYKKATKKFNKG